MTFTITGCEMQNKHANVHTVATKVSGYDMLIVTHTHTHILTNATYTQSAQ